jgi:acyl carrier protein
MERRQFTMLGLVAAVRLVGQQSCEPPADGKKSTFSKSEIATRVKKLVIEQLGVEPAKVTDAARFAEDLGADSLDMVELTMVFEEAFDIEITDDESSKIKTVGDAVTGVTERLRFEKRLSDESSWLLDLAPPRFFFFGRTENRA